MSSLFLICAAVAALLTVLSLGIGVVSMAKPPEFRERYANRLMKLRVISQGAAILFMVLAFSAYQS